MLKCSQSFGKMSFMNNQINGRSFFSSQNKVALLLFILLGFQAVASSVSSIVMAVISTISPELAANGVFTQFLDMLTYVVYIGAPILIYPAISKRKLKSYVSFRPRLPRDGAAAVFLCVGLMYFGQIFSWLMTEFFSSVGINIVYNSTTEYSGVLSYVILFVSTAVLPAFLEEIMIRGIVLGELAPYGKSFAIVVSGMLFGLMHMNPVQLPFACIAGVAIAYFVMESGSMWIGVIAHFINNGLSVAQEIMSNELSQTAYNTVSSVIDITVFTLAILSMLYIFSRGRTYFKARDTSGGLPACADCGEALRVDCSGGLSASMSPALKAYIVVALISALSVPLTIWLNSVIAL